MITFLFYYFLIAIFIGLFFIHTLDNIKNIRKNILKDKIIHFPNRKLIKILGVDKYNKLKSMLKQ